MAYDTKYPKVNQIDIPAAYDLARQLDRKLPPVPTKEEHYQDAMIALARRAAELEEEWS